MADLMIKLSRGLADVFQHCHLFCTANCCGWDAFDFTEVWLRRWCEFREPRDIARVLEETETVLGELLEPGVEDVVEIGGWFAPRCGELVEVLTRLQSVCLSFQEPEE